MPKPHEYKLVPISQKQTTPCQLSTLSQCLAVTTVQERWLGTKSRRKLLRWCSEERL